MKKLLAISLILSGIITSGCSLTIEGKAFYPEMRTKNGGSFGDPRESRKNELKYGAFRVSPENYIGGNIQAVEEFRARRAR